MAQRRGEKERESWVRAEAVGKGRGAVFGSLSEGRGGGRARAIQGPVCNSEKCGFCPGILGNLLKAVKCTSDTVRSRFER